MDKPSIKILHLEDSDIDAIFVRELLKKSESHIVIERARDRSEFLSMLEKGTYDLILSDFQVPGFDGFAALELSLQKQPKVPFVFVSGAMGEELAVESLKQGATDYILKQRMARLPSAIERAVKESRERKALEEADARLKESNERLALIRSSCGIGVWCCDLPLDVMDWDERVKSHFFLPADTTVNMEIFFERIHPEDREAVRRAIESALKNRTVYDLDYRTINPENGDVRWIRALGQAIYDEGGNPIRFDGMTLDITDRKKAESKIRESEARLREQDQKKDEFLATLAHELRNPLAPVRTGITLLRRALNDQDREKALIMMERQVGHMVRLIDDLLDVSRITRGKVTLKKELVNIKQAIESALEVSRSLIEEEKHELRLNLPDKELFVRGDFTRLAQVISNILNNAAKYTPAGGKIELKVEEDDSGNIILSVQDNGIGISAESLDHIFEMFHQGHLNPAKQQNGLGIGLALSHLLVTMHGGSLKAESEGPGKGSRFIITVPKAEPLVDTATLNGKHTEPAGSRPRKILVVDDNVDGAESLSALLELDGHTINVAYSGPDAIKAAHEFGPEVVFLDIGLPGMDGYEVARHIRREFYNGHSPVLIAVTGWGTEEDRKRAKAAGFDHHLTKPVEAERISALLSELS